MSSMAGAAKAWFASYGRDCAILAEFETTFTKHFMDTRAIQQLAAEKMAMLKKDDTVKLSQHLHTVIELCRKANPEMSDEKKVLKFTKTLNTAQASVLAVPALPKSITELHQRVQSSEEAVNQMSLRQEQSSPRASGERGRSRSRDRSLVGFLFDEASSTVAL